MRAPARSLLLATSIPVLIAASPIQAQQAPVADEAASGQTVSWPDAPITVVGQPLALPIGDRAYSVTTVTPEMLANEPSQRLENALRLVPGLQQFRRSDARSANPTSQGVTLRGLGGNASSRVLMLLDGVPQSDPFGGWISFPGYDALNLAGVRVRRGGGTGSDGPGALAGTIELDSAGIRADQSNVYADLAYGSRDSLEASLGTSQALGQGGLTLSAQYARGDGFIPVIAAQRGTVDRPAPFEQLGVNLRFVAPISATTELQASARAFTDERERGFAFSDNRNEGADASLRLVGRGSLPWSALAYVQVRSFESSFAAVSADRSTATQSLDQYNTPSTGLGARAEIRPSLGSAGELRLGAEWRRTTGETRELFTFVAGSPTRLRRAGGASETLGAFAEASWQASPDLLLTGGGRLDYWRLTDGRLNETVLATGAPLTSTAFEDRSGWEGTGRVGFAWDAAGLLKIRGAGYLGWRLPTLNELYRPFRVGPDATAANAALAPERLRGAELGFDYEIYTIRLGATLFWNRLDNAIANVTLARGPGTFPGVGFVSAAGSFSQRQNLDAVEARGVELEARADIGDFDVMAAYSYVDAEVRAAPGQAAIDGRRPAQVPRHFATGSVGWFPDGGDSGFNLTARYTGSQFEDDLGQLSLDDAVTLDARAALRINRQLLVELRGENLFDTTVQAGISGPGIIERASPRTIWLGLKLDIE
ncbi:outer membrane receptor protein involved in Fe transport [Blastomonas natatoria]|uniref:Outer membrane receptor protein involved in Fe transport n=1 Tax=Blastomonas natatoria TaxID=34015 RepID=A0A2V3UQI8_9SPHN|nr:TonB-dependent receptor [Blastomonas natatoria]PXW69549.1 outer membrane receptor protein involved in Fe transport [Blastomonas natatoria]